MMKARKVKQGKYHLAIPNTALLVSNSKKTLPELAATSPSSHVLLQKMLLLPLEHLLQQGVKALREHRCEDVPCCKLRCHLIDRLALAEHNPLRGLSGSDVHIDVQQRSGHAILGKGISRRRRPRPEAPGPQWLLATGLGARAVRTAGTGAVVCSVPCAGRARPMRRVTWAALDSRRGTDLAVARWSGPGEAVLLLLSLLPLHLTRIP